MPSSMVPGCNSFRFLLETSLTYPRFHSISLSQVFKEKESPQFNRAFSSGNRLSSEDDLATESLSSSENSNIFPEIIVSIIKLNIET